MNAEEREALDLMAKIMEGNARATANMQIQGEDYKNERIEAAAEGIHAVRRDMFDLLDALVPMALPGLENALYRLHDIAADLTQLSSYGGTKTTEKLIRDGFLCQCGGAFSDGKCTDCKVEKK